MKNTVNNSLKSIYTFYWDTDNRYQKYLIELWKFSWKQAGYNPIVLTKDDVITHPSFEKYQQNIFQMLDFILANCDKSYTSRSVLSFLRWIAFANQDNDDDEPFFVSDFDVFNINYAKNAIDNLYNFHKKLIILDQENISLAFGRKNDFENICTQFSNFYFLHSHFSKIKKQSNFSDRSWFKMQLHTGDYKFVQHVTHGNKLNLLDKKNKLTHISHWTALGDYDDDIIKNNKYNISLIKIFLAKKVLDF